MAGLFEKFRTLVLSNLHGLLDRAIDLNSVEAVKQYIRDLETAQRELNASLAEAMGQVSGLNRQIQENQANAGKLDADITLLLSDDDPSNDHHALTMQTEFDALGVELAELQAQLAEGEATRDALQQAARQLSDKHGGMVKQLRTLSVQSAAAKAKNRAADALEAASSAVSGVNGPSVDDLTARIKAQSDTASARFDLAVGGLGSPDDDPAKAVAESKAAAAIQARLAKINAAAVAQATPGRPFGAGHPPVPWGPHPHSWAGTPGSFLFSKLPSWGIYSSGMDA